MLITLMFSAVVMKPGVVFSLVSHTQLISRSEGAGREHSQTASQAGQQKYSVP